MSLGDLNKQVNIAGQKAYSDAHDRMLKEKKAHDTFLENQKKDKLRQEVSHDRLESNRVQGELARAKRELFKLKSSKPDARTNNLIRTMENQIKALEGQIRLIDSQIKTKTTEINRK